MRNKILKYIALIILVISFVVGVNLSLQMQDLRKKALESTAAFDTQSVQLVPTFNSVGVYGDSLGCTGTLAISYRPFGSSTWNTGHPLQCKAGQFRGSLVKLNSGTTYEVKLGNELSIYTVSTWNESYPIGKVTELPPLTSDCSNNANLTINSSDSGTESGYHLFKPASSAAVLDGQGTCNYNIFVGNNTHHVIIRGLELKNAGQDAIMLSDGDEDDRTDGAQNIIIDGNNIHSWGESGLGGGEDHGAISSEFTCRYCLGGIKRIVIQNNDIHHPNGNSNDWDSGHPQGPRAVHFVSPQGQIVIRNNKMYSDDSHRYNDVIGGRKNGGPVGSVGRDSDIYGNTVSHCWDDGIEVEGDNANVRVFDNNISHCYIGIAFASTVYGPLYVFNNLITDNARTGTEFSPSDTKSYGFKMGNSGAECHPDESIYGMGCGDGFGFIYLYHNTVAADDYSYAPKNGASDSGGPVKYLDSKNNIFNGTGDCIDAPDSTTSSTNDVCNGNFNVGILSDPIYGKAMFVSDSFTPLNGSIAQDSGVNIANFNDNYVGSAPDVGAFESGTSVVTPTTTPSPTICNTCYNFNSSSDGLVDIQDILFVANIWGATLGSSNYNPIYDVFCSSSSPPDGTINISDIQTVANKWGISSCAP